MHNNALTKIIDVYRGFSISNEYGNVNFFLAAFMSIKNAYLTPTKLGIAHARSWEDTFLPQVRKELFDESAKWPASFTISLELAREIYMVRLGILNHLNTYAGLYDFTAERFDRLSKAHSNEPPFTLSQLNDAVSILWSNDFIESLSHIDPAAINNIRNGLHKTAREKLAENDTFVLLGEAALEELRNEAIHTIVSLLEVASNLIGGPMGYSSMSTNPKLISTQLTWKYLVDAFAKKNGVPEAPICIVDCEAM